MKFVFLLTLSSLGMNFYAQNNEKSDSVVCFGVESKKSSFFRNRYHFNDLVHYLDNQDDYVTYESETTGQYNSPEQLIFSVAGKSFKWNRYYLNGFRIDSRFAPGSTNYRPDMYSNSLELDYYRSVINLNTDSCITPAAFVTYNMGGMGGVAPGTDRMVNWFHKTATQRMWESIDYRAKMKGALTAGIDYSLPAAGKMFNQQLRFDFGNRQLVDFGYNSARDYSGITNFYTEGYANVQLSGEIPAVLPFFDSSNYLCSYRHRDNMYTEFYFSKDESAKNDAYNLSVYGSKKNESLSLTSGLTLEMNAVRHNKLNFSRNVIDQDGEAFEPWYADGLNTELSHAIKTEYRLSKDVSVRFDGYNSLYVFQPSTSFFSNTLYSENTSTSYQPGYTSLYVYNWKSNAYAAGLLENTLSLNLKRTLGKVFTLRANADLTFDGMLQTANSLLKPNWQAQLGVDVHPSQWIDMELNLGRNRVSFTLDDIRFLSDSYMNADIYYWNDANANKAFDQGEQGNYFSSTGGKYHSLAGGLRQQSYYTVDLPVRLHLGKCFEVAWLNTYSKYIDTWTVRYDKDATEYGYYVADRGDYKVKSAREVHDKTYFLNGGVAPNYVVDQYPEYYKSRMRTSNWYNFLVNDPYYFSSTFRIQYQSPKLMAVMSWCSYIQTGVSTLGNGPLHNNLGVLSESAANPNTRYESVGRLNQDRAYVVHLFCSYNINEHLSCALSGKFKDGQPFTTYMTQTVTSSNGATQLAMWSYRAKGINPYTNEFGSRKDAFFNLDLSAGYKGVVAGHNCMIQARMYNVYDFSTELLEYTFEPNVYSTSNPKDGSRYALSMCVPRGVMVTAKVDL